MQTAGPEIDSAFIPTRTERRAMDWSLVLASQEIPTTIHRSERFGWLLIVAAADYERALDAIRHYRDENRHWHWRQPLPWSSLPFHWGGVIVGGILALVHHLGALQPALHEAWLFKSEAIRSGEWWRLFTAVLLHADLAHLMANVTTGILLFGLAMARFGSGTALLAAYLAGALGNVAGLILYGKPYTGLGASGMVMGALGLLTFHSANLWRRNPAASRILLRGFLAGILLFVVLGSNPNSDVIAHLGGFVAGGLLGAILSHVPIARLEHDRAVIASSWSALLLLLALTCFLALRG